VRFGSIGDMTLDRQTSEFDRSSRKHVRFGGGGLIGDDPSVTRPADLDRDAAAQLGESRENRPRTGADG
jgi:hypothetical protein